ncbi:hypothetical protein JZ751_028120 [Albula glossodonta]|uniref:Uncharacterized protein n=1 Tax=Albula glossodonta TaxID=121402 RepID=A0A8T2PJ54_9TELE|nr:hypothetical protein JZ751_028120 [Albula glossodonta]
MGIHLRHENNAILQEKDVPGTTKMSDMLEEDRISPPLPGSAVPMRCSTAPQFEKEGDRCRLVNTGVRQSLSSALIQEVRGQQSAETCSTFWLLQAPSDRGAGVFQGKRPPMYPTAWDALTFGRNSREDEKKKKNPPFR